jgi:outer membrane scaffolding protein for murein synthesis (MipA/OmpV family)
VAVIGTYSLNPSWTLLYGLQTTTLDDEIEDSPIGDEDTYTVGFVGAGWSF